jgi:hypothetical protein
MTQAPETVCRKHSQHKTVLTWPTSVSATPSRSVTSSRSERSASYTGSEIRATCVWLTWPRSTAGSGRGSTSSMRAAARGECQAGANTESQSSDKLVTRHDTYCATAGSFAHFATPTWHRCGSGEGPSSVQPERPSRRDSLVMGVVVVVGWVVKGHAGTTSRPHDRVHGASDDGEGHKGDHEEAQRLTPRAQPKPTLHVPPVGIEQCHRITVASEGGGHGFNGVGKGMLSRAAQEHAGVDCVYKQ